MRIHTDENAAISAQAANALAFTIGNNVVFGAGGYVPNTSHSPKNRKVIKMTKTTAWDFVSVRRVCTIVFLSKYNN